MGPKAKGQKMGLGEFLGDSSLGSWADEMEDMPLPSTRNTSYGGGGGGFGSSGGGMSSAPGGRFEGFSQRDPLPLPSKPPYTTHLGNLSFDATEGDLLDLFASCEVTSVRIVEDKLERKPKGFAYVEYATLEGLKKALEFSGTPFQGRNIRVSVAEPQKDRPETRVLDDWSRKGPLQPIDGPAGGRRPSDRGGFGGGFQRGLDAGPDRERGERRAPFDPNDRVGAAREMTWERRGPLEATAPAPSAGRPLNPEGNDGPRERRNSPAWGEGRGEPRSQDGSRPPRREFSERPIPVREPTAADKDTQWRTKMRPDPVEQPAPSPKLDVSAPTSPRAPAAAPASRPKLNLQKRTVSQAEPSPALPSGDSSKANPFGAARPVDTLAREKEVEEKLKIKREQDAKEREEKRAADQKAKEEARAVRDKEKGEKFAKARERAGGPSKDGEGEDKSKAAKYEILRRAEGGEEEDLETAGEDAHANGQIPGDKSTNPQEIVVDPKADNAEAQTSEQLEDDGWSTVGAVKGKKGRNNGGSRALAS